MKDDWPIKLSPSSGAAPVQASGRFVESTKVVLPEAKNREISAASSHARAWGKTDASPMARRWWEASVALAMGKSSISRVSESGQQSEVANGMCGYLSDFLSNGCRKFLDPRVDFRQLAMLDEHTDFILRAGIADQVAAAVAKLSRGLLHELLQLG